MSEIQQPPGIGQAQIDLLARLCNAMAVSGDEGEVRKIVSEEVKNIVDSFKVDALGNVLAIKKAKVSNPLKVMLAAHMDEVGFMLVDEDEPGLYRMGAVGGIDERVLVGKVVMVGKDHLPGVIGARPIHLSERGDLDRKLTLDSLRIDLGEKKAKVGDRATFGTKFRQEGPSLIAKALDDRLGVATLIELLKHAPENIELMAAFTVQEEVGLRGARVAAYALNPDMAIALDSTPAFDQPVWDGSENGVYNCRLGYGPAIYIADAGTLSDPRLIRHLVQTAEDNKIPYQFRQPGGGGTDAGAIHKQRAGIPSVSISVPGRYAHTPILVARLDDWKNTLALVYQALVSISPAVLAEPR